MPVLALDPDPAAVELDETLGKGEAETGALALLHADIGLVKLLEDPLSFLGDDARTRVGHRHPHFAVDTRRGDDDAASLRRELDRVREQVEDDLADAALVAVDQIHVGCEL